MKILIQTLTLSAALILFTNDSFAGKQHRGAVGKRIHHQQKRINAGVKSGELTPDEAKEQRENLREIRKERRTEVKENGGPLTGEQRKDLNQKLNENSKEIHEEKHD